MQLSAAFSIRELSQLQTIFEIAARRCVNARYSTCYCIHNHADNGMSKWRQEVALEGSFYSSF